MFGDSQDHDIATFIFFFFKTCKIYRISRRTKSFQDFDGKSPGTADVQPTTADNRKMTFDYLDLWAP